MTDEKKICGIIMPISMCDDQGPEHWHDVKQIIEAAAKEAGFQARLVSDTFESNLIHKEILQNVYQDDIIVCDVSGRNPNVFFELGIRMATQKPTVIVKDDVTVYPFDTGPNRYIEYPRGLRHPDMEKFKRELVKALQMTLDHGQEKSFIAQMGPFTVPEVETKSAPVDEIVLERLQKMEHLLKKFMSANSYISQTDTGFEKALEGVRGKKVLYRRVGENSGVAFVAGYHKSAVRIAIDNLCSQPLFEGIEILVEIERDIVTLRFEGQLNKGLDVEKTLKNALEEASPF